MKRLSVSVIDCLIELEPRVLPYEHLVLQSVPALHVSDVPLLQHTWLMISPSSHNKIFIWIRRAAEEEQTTHDVITYVILFIYHYYVSLGLCKAARYEKSYPDNIDFIMVIIMVIIIDFSSILITQDKLNRFYVIKIGNEVQTSS